MAAGAVRVLVVEDNPADAKLLELAVRREDGGPFHLERVARVTAAEEMLRERGVDAIFLDLGLPDSRGFDGLRRLRASAPSAAIVVLSGSEDPDVVRRAIVEGADAFRSKGLFAAGEISDLLQRTIARRRLELVLDTPELSAAVRELLNALPEPALVADDGEPVAVNPRFTAETGIHVPDRSPGPPSPWLEEALATGRAGPTLDPTRAATDVAQGRVDDGGAAAGEQREYVARVVRGELPRRILLTLRRPAVYAPLWGTVRSSSAADVAEAGGAIDTAVWHELELAAGGDRAFLENLVTTWLDESSRLVTTLERARAADDRLELARAAHDLKSSSAELGAVDLGRVCDELERSAPTGRASALEEIVLRLVAERARAGPALRALAPSLADGDA